MFMVIEDLKVGLLTDHLPVNEVSDAITPELVEAKINKIYDSLVKDFRFRKPKIAVLVINQNTGDNGVIVILEYIVFIITIEQLKQTGMYIYYIMDYDIN